MSVDNYIAKQALDRQDLLTKIHKAIIESDKSVKATIGLMMGKEMILYNAPGIFKYGLSSVKNYISLHVMPIYASTSLYSKYKELLPQATFQKGCINFKNEDEMPLSIVKRLFEDCSKVDLLKIKEDYWKSKKT